MARRVFFSFHYDDVVTFRANVVRNHDMMKESDEAGFFDASIWEDAELHGADSVKRLINKNLENTTVTCALIGSNTWKRRWVRYEILKSYDRGNALIGVHINGVRDKNQQTFGKGNNPFDFLGFMISNDGKKRTYYEHDGAEWKIYSDLSPTPTNYEQKYWGKWFQLSKWVQCYDWVTNDGYNNFPAWVEQSK